MGAKPWNQVGAHKLLLAGASQVFRKQFFGSLKETSDLVVIKDTTVEAFTTMINYIYMAPGEKKFSLAHVTCPQTLCEILNVSQRFQLPGLFAIVKDVLKALPITAATAKNYSVFEDVSKMLMAKCGTFLAESLKTAEDVLSFILQSKESYPEADPELIPDLLREKARSIRSASRKCSNCGRKPSDCLDGKSVTGREYPPTVRVGLAVKGPMFVTDRQPGHQHQPQQLQPVHGTITDTRTMMRPVPPITRNRFPVPGGLYPNAEGNIRIQVCVNNQVRDGFNKKS